MKSLATRIEDANRSGLALAADDRESCVQTITVLLPLLYNPNALGIRLPVGIKKIARTIEEMKHRFSGFSLSLCAGWCKEDQAWDLHIRAHIDIKMDLSAELELLSWEKVLKDRFRQRSTYMSASAPIRWL